eukprot:m.338315 g.338315  ORF g.338315 m.338315 type:complete len:1651 (+) comp18384_c0_seq1:214-5166(+)
MRISTLLVLSVCCQAVLSAFVCEDIICSNDCVYVSFQHAGQSNPTQEQIDAKIDCGWNAFDNICSSNNHFTTVNEFNMTKGTGLPSAGCGFPSTSTTSSSTSTASSITSTHTSVTETTLTDTTVTKTTVTITTTTLTSATDTTMTETTTATTITTITDTTVSDTITSKTITTQTLPQECILFKYKGPVKGRLDVNTRIGNPIDQRKLDSPLVCGSLCKDEPTCKSFSFRPYEPITDLNARCLLHTTTSLDNLVAHTIFVHYREVPGCETTQTTQTNTKTSATVTTQTDTTVTTITDTTVTDTTYTTTSYTSSTLSNKATSTKTTQSTSPSTTQTSTPSSTATTDESTSPEPETLVAKTSTTLTEVVTVAQPSTYCNLPCAPGTGGPCRVAAVVGACRAYNNVSGELSCVSTLAEIVEDCTDLPNRWDFSLTDDENNDAGNVQYGAEPHDINEIYAGACADCTDKFGNCRASISGKVLCFKYHNDTAMECPESPFIENCPRTERKANETDVDDIEVTTCDKFSTIGEEPTTNDPFLLCPTEICAYGTSGYCFQPHTQMCLPFMPGTYEQGSDVLTGQCYPNTVSCYFEIKANCTTCQATPGPCKVNIFNNQGPDLCLPHARVESYRDLVETGQISCDEVPSPRTCQEGTLPCGDITRPRMSTNCPASICEAGTFGPCYKKSEDGGAGLCALHIESASRLSQTLPANVQSADVNGDKIIDWAQTLVQTGVDSYSVTSQETCPDGYVDCSELSFQCPQGNLCRKDQATMFSSGFDVNSLNTTASFDTVTIKTDRVGSDTSVESFVGINVDGDAAQDLLLTTTTHISVFRNSILNVSQCIQQTAGGAEPVCGPDVSSGPCIPQTSSVSDEATCGLDYSQLSFDRRFSEVVLVDRSALPYFSVNVVLTMPSAGSGDTCVNAGLHFSPPCVELVMKTATADIHGDGTEDIYASRFVRGPVGDARHVLDLYTQKEEDDDGFPLDTCSTKSDCFRETTLSMTSPVSGFALSLAAQDDIVVFGTTDGVQVFRTNTSSNTVSPVATGFAGIGILDVMVEKLDGGMMIYGLDYANKNILVAVLTPVGLRTLSPIDLSNLNHEGPKKMHAFEYMGKKHIAIHHHMTADTQPEVARDCSTIEASYAFSESGTPFCNIASAQVSIVAIDMQNADNLQTVTVTGTNYPVAIQAPDDLLLEKIHDVKVGNFLSSECPALLLAAGSRNIMVNLASPNCTQLYRTCRTIDECDATIDVTSTSTTVSTVTIKRCNGALDNPAVCDSYKSSPTLFCSLPSVQVACPALCDTCPGITQTSTTSSVTVLPTTVTSNTITSSTTSTSNLELTCVDESPDCAQLDASLCLAPPAGSDQVFFDVQNLMLSNCPKLCGEPCFPCFGSTKYRGPVFNYTLTIQELIKLVAPNINIKDAAGCIAACDANPSCTAFLLQLQDLTQDVCYLIPFDKTSYGGSSLYVDPAGGEELELYTKDETCGTRRRERRETCISQTDCIARRNFFVKNNASGAVVCCDELDNCVCMDLPEKLAPSSSALDIPVVGAVIPTRSSPGFYFVPLDNTKNGNSEFAVSDAVSAHLSGSRVLIADADSDGDHDLFSIRPRLSTESGVARSWTVEYLRNNNDGKAGRCQAITTITEEYDDVCTSCAEDETNCLV